MGGLAYHMVYSRGAFDNRINFPSEFQFLGYLMAAGFIV